MKRWPFPAERITASAFIIQQQNYMECWNVGILE
jgi:hypothetical protein